MTERSELQHTERDPAEELDRVDHLIADLKALIEKYQRPDKPIDLAICELCGLEKLGKIVEKF